MCLVRVSSELSSFARKVGSGKVSSVLRGLTMGLVLLAMLNSVWKAWSKLGCALPQTQSICCSPNTNPFPSRERGCLCTACGCLGVQGPHVNSLALPEVKKLSRALHQVD